MTYAVDSNVILDILYDDPRYVQLSIDALAKASWSVPMLLNTPTP